MQKVKCIPVLTSLVAGIFSKLSSIDCKIKPHLLQMNAGIFKTVFTYKIWKAQDLIYH